MRLIRGPICCIPIDNARGIASDPVAWIVLKLSKEFDASFGRVRGMCRKSKASNRN